MADDVDITMVCQISIVVL